VLFADLKGSMELLADRDPEEARKLLDPVLERMMEAVHRYEGTVNQVMGDGIMALFGAPVAHEDHAVRACYAALDMQTVLHRYAEEVRRTHGLGGVAIRAGLNSGEVVVRAIGSDLRMDYTAVGQTTHLAARMEQLASPGTTLLTAGTLRLAEGFIAAKPLGPIPVKGLEAPVEVYEMTGAGTMRSRLHAAAGRGLTRFVGRDSELEQLRKALGHAATGHGQVVAIIGEPGVGKSRLVWEVTHSHRVHGWLVLQAGSVSYGKATSYLPVVDLLKSYFTIEDRDGPRVVQEKMTGKLLTLERAQEDSLPALLALLLPSGDVAWEGLDPRQRRQRTLHALKQLLIRESQVQPLLVVIEDLHWIDSETQALLDGLVESLPAARLLLLVNYRPEYQPPWGSRTYYTQLRLDHLPPETAEELLGGLLGHDTGLDPLKRMLIARTEGNPFFLEESVRALVETGALAGERGAYRLARTLPAIEVPATVQAVLAARIDRLAPGDKALLQTASVVGKDVPFALLQTTAALGEDELRIAIGRLQAAEFLYETSLFPDLEYTFKHALTHDVAYGSLLHERRRILHARIVEAIERHTADRLRENVEQLAHHAVKGALWEKAVTYCRRAAARAYARSAVAAAAVALQQAIDALAQLPQTPEAVELGVDLRIELRNPLTLLGDFDTVLECLVEAERLARILGDPRRLGWVLSYVAEHHRLTGNLDAALANATQALALTTTVDDPGLRIASNLYLAQTHVSRGDYRRAVDHLTQNVDALRGDLLRERLGMVGFPSVITRSWLARSLAELGEFREASTAASEAMAIAEELSHAPSVCHAWQNASFVHLRQGEMRPAIILLERCLALATDQVPLYVASSAAYLGWAYAWSGRSPEGLPLLRESVERIRTDPLITMLLGEACLLEGRPGEAACLALKALDLARRQGARGSQAHILQRLGAIAAHPDLPEMEAAESRYREALVFRPRSHVNERAAGSPS
jgi:class 3 adenylate cyclase/tetratricopeptide (TPR) repeat protein